MRSSALTSLIPAAALLSFSFALAFCVAAVAETASESRTATQEGRERAGDTSWIETGFARKFGIHEPIYFIHGSRDPAAKFQISFKYRLLGDPGDVAPLRTTRGLFFGYTQRSIWDIKAISGPFHDTSYMPELLYQSAVPVPNSDDFQLAWLGWQASVLHESNGRDGPESRSIDIIYFRPAFLLGCPNGWRLVFSPKILTNIRSLRENPDIKKYRGYAEWRFSVGKKFGVELATNARIGSNARHGSVQFDLTYPVKIPSVDFAAYLHVQYFEGYGESILDYYKRVSKLRFGFSVSR